MAGRVTEADRLRQCRLIFDRAMRDGTSTVAAREALAREHWRAIEARLSRCGTQDTGSAPEPSPALDDDRREQPQFYWQRD
jgi:hypothetical protein